MTSTGRQEDADTWVLSPEIQINSFGELVPPEEHQFYWYNSYQIMSDTTEEQRLTQLDISMPLGYQVILHILLSISIVLYIICFGVQTIAIVVPWITKD